MENQNIEEKTAIAEVKATAIAPITPTEQVLTPLQIADYSQFLYDTNFGGTRGKDFTAEWDEITWQQVLTELTELAEWVQTLSNPF